ncbi:MAG TPA: 6-carboxytetrahydropterin synthase [Thermoanaerobaculia bacterium]|nr:6-carboxytetrahydropterin synthase [Thermoanaerobaculia bacterium]HQR66885.1 6-carboxytetrahydropterin synthase [Thermoanaerobaculia bacterium]
MLLLSRTIHFNAAHRLWNPAKSEAWNRATFGDAAGPSGYGHNYALEVSVAGPVDAEDGMILNLTDLDRILREEVDRPLDHRNLNAEIPEFARTVPTAENLARWIWDRVSARLAAEGGRCRLVSLTLRVTPTFAVELAEPSPASLRG